jgi:gliding motility-associated transport system ATP-binding protein
MIEVDSVSKNFGAIQALHDITFQVQEGDIIGLLGPNGAGKTTTMRILACFIPPSAGSVRIDGLDTDKDSLAIRQRVGYFLEKASIYPDMRVAAFLDFVARIKKVPRDSRGKVVSEAMEFCGLSHMKDRIIGNLSKGYAQRVGLAQALLNKPKILLLDEPTIGLDPEQVVEIRNLIHDMSGQRTVILSSHILPEVSQICNRVIIIDKGRIIAIDTPEKLSARMQDSNRFKVRIEAPDGGVTAKLKGIPGMIRVEEGTTLSGGTSDYLVQAGKDVDIPRQLCALAFSNQWVLRDMREIKMSLEDVFLKLVTREKVSI